MFMNNCIHSANIKEEVNYTPVRKAVRINPEAPQMTAVNLRELCVRYRVKNFDSKPWKNLAI